MPDELGGVATIEAPEAVEPAEISAEPTETPSEGAEPAEPGAEEAPAEETPAKPAGKQQINVKDAARKHGAALNAIAPGLAEAVRLTAFQLGGYQSLFPDGLKEAKALKETFASVGGSEGIREIQESVGDYQKLEGLFEKGDGQFFSLLAEASPQAFSAVMPSGLETWKAKDPDSYNHVLAQVMVQTLDSAKFSDTLEAVWARIPNDAENKPLKDALATLWTTVDGFRKVAEKAPEKKVSPQEEALTKKEQELAQREQRAFLAPVSTAGKNHLAQIVDAEMNRGYQWATASADVKGAVNDRIVTEIKAASSKDKTFVADYNRFVQRGDAQGLERHIKNFQQRVGPGIVEKVARLFNVKPKGAGVAKPAVAAKPNAAPVARVGTTDWVRVPKQPSPMELDRRLTTPDMILDSRAILKGGKRVTWA